LHIFVLALPVSVTVTNRPGAGPYGYDARYSRSPRHGQRL